LQADRSGSFEKLSGVERKIFFGCIELQRWDRIELQQFTDSSTLVFRRRVHYSGTLTEATLPIACQRNENR
jgi:hypothetical protein